MIKILKEGKDYDPVKLTGYDKDGFTEILDKISNDRVKKEITHLLNSTGINTDYLYGFLRGIETSGLIGRNELTYLYNTMLDK